MIKASQESTKGSGLSFLTTPYLGKAILKSMELKKVGSVENSIEIVFELKEEDVNGNSVNGIEYSEAIWAPDENDTEDIQKKADRTSYIVSRLVSKDLEPQVLAISGNTWIEYANNMIQFVRANGGFQRTDIQVKVPGSTYGGNFKVKFPGYKDFISNSERAPLTWSNKELEENAKYLAGKNSSPDTMASDTSSLADLDDQKF